MGMIQNVQRALGLTVSEQRSGVLPFDEWVSYFNFNNYQYPFRQTLVGDPSQPVSGTFTGFDTIYKSNGIIYACMAARQDLFSQARFTFRQLRKGQPGDYFGTPALDILHRPWPNGTAGDLENVAILHADLAGNFFAVRRGPNRIGIMRPDWVTLVIGSNSTRLSAWDVDAQVIGYIYEPEGPGSGREPEIYLPEVVAHWMPKPDPTFRFRGMSWLTPLIREIQADSAATDHKGRFFEHGATPNMIVTTPITDPDKFKRFVEMFRADQEGAANAYKTLHLAAGAEAKVVGSDLKQLDFKVTQGAGESRIAAAAGMHPTIVGLSEGLQGSSLNSGNFGAARRLTGDKTLRPLWQGFAEAMSAIVDVPSAAELWYDDRHIPFLQEDVKDAAEVQKVQVASIRQLVDAGFTPESVIDAIQASDFKRLKHSGLMSVQLLPPGTKAKPETPDESQGPPDGGSSSTSEEASENNDE